MRDNNGHETSLDSGYEKAASDTRIHCISDQIDIPTQKRHQNL